MKMQSQVYIQCSSYYMYSVDIIYCLFLVACCLQVVRAAKELPPVVPPQKSCVQAVECRRRRTGGPSCGGPDKRSGVLLRKIQQMGNRQYAIYSYIYIIYLQIYIYIYIYRERERERDNTSIDVYIYIYIYIQIYNNSNLYIRPITYCILYVTH